MTMNISFAWLRELVDLTKETTPEEVARRLTNSGTEVEEVRPLSRGLEMVRVAKILECERHPNADRLSLCKVDSGAGMLQIVCGAKNARRGLTVALAPVGAKLPNGLHIQRAKIRGVDSEGMLCSPAELGLATESEGILELAESFKAGALFTEVMGLDDTVLVLAVTPNRGDLLSHFGVAREVAALFSRPLKKIATDVAREKSDGGFTISLKESDSCPEYLGCAVENISIVPSPEAIQKRLSSLGLRPVNQVVDATNYVLMELGHPTHAFDADRLGGTSVIVETAKKSRRFRLLDGKEVDLLSGDLMIANAKGPLALAGIMGGDESAIQEGTKRLFLECAVFHPGKIRASARRLGLMSEASFRFERGVDRATLPLAIDRLCQLIATWTREAGKPAPKFLKVVEATSIKRQPSRVSLEEDFVNRRLGTTFKKEDIRKPLLALGLKVVDEKKNLFEIPSHRSDLTRPIDLVEEVARLKGYDQLPTSMPRPQLQTLEVVPIVAAKSKLGEILRQHGFSEAVSLSLTDPKRASAFVASKNHLKLRNPLSEEQSILRPTLLVELLKAMAFNRDHGSKNVRLFEIGKTFRGPLPGKEAWHLAALATGLWTEPSWAWPARGGDFYDMKALFSACMNIFHDKKIMEIQLDSKIARNYPFLHPGKAVELQLNGQVLGFYGCLHPGLLVDFGVEDEVFCFEMALDDLLPLPSQRSLRALSPFPSVERDLALVVPEKVTAKSLEDLIFSTDNGMIERLSVFDLYRGKQLPEGKKSIAFTIRYALSDRTLTAEEVEGLEKKILNRLAKELGAELRQ